MKIQDRSISDREAAVIRESLLSAPVVKEVSSFLRAVPALRVIGRCECGCASVDFGPPAPGPSIRIADGVGTTESGGTVGVMVWAADGRIIGLEIYDLGAGEDDQTLPRAGSIRATGSMRTT